MTTTNENDNVTVATVAADVANSSNDSQSNFTINTPELSASCCTKSQQELQQQKQQQQPRVVRRRRRNQAKDDAIVIDPKLLETAMKESNLPSAYSFEITKTVQRILQLNARHVALQMPEGLLLYASVLADVLKRLVAATCRKISTNDTVPTDVSSLQVSILGDVTYGACCVDDLGAQALGCDLLVHYGHSCLVPIQHTAIPCLYVFVEITIDVDHLIECFQLTMQEQIRQNGNCNDASLLPHVYLLGTIQFRHALSQAKTMLQEKGYDVSIPQAKPLSPGEVLGCTSPVLATTTAESTSDGHHVNALVLFVADGRFHLESTLISNPQIPLFLRYDPYSKTMTEESYQHDQMHTIRRAAIRKAQNGKVFGIILGTLGRQGNPAILHRLQTLLRAHDKRSFVMLASEITPSKLALFGSKVDAWVQIACPRLSVDWGHHLSPTTPVLNPYELFVCLGETEFQERYPMDYYASAGGPWSNYHGNNSQRQHNLAVETTSSY
ncbi:diphthamide biosynthesis enzyme Dph2 [Nitzschia inconspicua]|uniref:2-(3-amino-3-carboxypropyl)histidine synthase subunit 1 n=1 Tax=Nitzschia inconspicua TaxID=303405 RepID=A0A9K3L934_9STRA|nr:diphthamide biosynthesis enzyme Dph2 [Nitzschia inconspicua]